MIDRLAARHGITGERLLKSSLLTVALHDVGKLTTNFGRMMKAADDKMYREACRQNYRHEIAGLWVVAEAARALAATDGAFPGCMLLETLAVAGHHRFLADGHLLDPGGFLNPLEWEPDPISAVQSALGLAKEMFRVQGWVLRLYQHPPETVRRNLSNENLNYPHECLLKVRDRICDEAARDRDRPGAFREIFIAIKGLLMTADWMASGHQDTEATIEVARHFLHIDSSELLGYVKAKVEREKSLRGDLTLFKGYRPFQEACGRAEGHVLAIAPTGSGKTEAACLWALHKSERGLTRKVFFLLPTMVTANSLHRRLEDFFGPRGHEVALVHSTADLVRQRPGSGAEDDDADRADIRIDHLGETHFFPPVVVGTVDQLLVTLFHAGRWPMKTLAAANAAIVIDEVHSYDPHTAGLIVRMIEQFRPLGARFMVMSATMPRDLQATIRGALGDTEASAPGPDGVTQVIDVELHDQARNEWTTVDCPLSSWLLDRNACSQAGSSEDFLRLIEQVNDRDEPIRILIVANTVKRCQEIAAALRNSGLDPVCYHSKFIFDHRREKERHLLEDRPRLVVATQVVEVSLDLDYDMLLTECAPIDALAQRAGRVNRFRRPIRGRIFVFRHEEDSCRIYSLNEVLEASWLLCRDNQGALTERRLIEMVDRAYSGMRLVEHPDFRHVEAVTRNLQHLLAGVLDCPQPWESENLKSRLEKYAQESVIPACFADVAQGSTPQERRRYELKVPAWYARKHLVRDNNPEGLPLCRMGYDAILGARLEVDADEPDPASMII